MNPQQQVAILNGALELPGPVKKVRFWYLPQIQQKAGSLDTGQIMTRVRGG
jgi:hypothetical protein